MRTYKMVATITATANNITSTQVLRNGRIKGIRYALDVDSVTDNAALRAEISINPVSQIGYSTIQGTIDQISWAGNFATSGLSQNGTNVSRSLDFAVGAGEFLYINSSVAGTLSGVLAVFVDVEEK